MIDMETYIARIVAEAPPLTDTQRQRIAALLGGAVGNTPARASERVEK